MATDLGTGFINILPKSTAFGPALIAKLKPALAAIESSTGLAFSGLEVAGIAAFAGITAASIKFATDFEKSMSRIQGLVGISADETARLSDEILNLATEVPVAPKELADALFFIESAGQRGDTAMETLRLSAMAAASGLGETKVVADAVTSAMNAYAGTGLTAAIATDTLIAAVREGKLEPATLAANLGQVLPVAAQLGVGFEEVAAGIASATREGLQATRAATGIRFLLAAFTKPTQQAQEALAGVGISVENLQNSLANRGLLPTLSTLAKRFDLSTAAGKAMFATVVGGVRGLSVASILVGKNAEDVKKIFADVAASAGSLNLAFSVAQDTMANQVKQLITTVQVLAIEFGRSLLPFAKDFIAVLKVMVGLLKPVAPLFSTIAASLAGFYILGKIATLFETLGTKAQAAGLAMQEEALAADTAALATEQTALAAETATASNELLATSGEQLALSFDEVAVGSQSAMFATEDFAAASQTSTAALETETVAAGDAAVAITVEGDAAVVAADEAEVLAAAEVDVARGAGAITGAVTTAGGGLAAFGKGLLASRTLLLPLIGILIQARKVVGGLALDSSDLANEFNISNDAATVISEGYRNAANSQSILSQATSLALLQQEDVKKAYSESYSTIAQGALDAGVSQQTLTAALAASQGAITTSTDGIANFENVLKGNISSINSIAIVQDKYNLGLNQQSAELAITGKAAKNLIPVWEANAGLYDRQLHGIAALTEAQAEHNLSIETAAIHYKDLNGQQQLLIDYGKDIQQGYQTIGPLFDQMGTSLGEFQAQAQEALASGQWDDFAATVRDDAAQAIADFSQTATENLSFVDDELEKLGEHASALQIAQAFGDAQADTKAFGNDLKEIGDILDGQGRALASYFLTTGDAVHAATIANADPKTQKLAVRNFNAQQGAVEEMSGAITNQLIPTLKDLNKLLEAIAGEYNVTMNLRDRATSGLNDLKAQLSTIDGHTYSFDVEGHIHQTISTTGDPGDLPNVAGVPDFRGRGGTGNGGATGGFIRGATGFITRGPTYLVGEGAYATPAGRGGEAIIPLNDRGKKYMEEAWGEKGKPSGPMHMTGELTLSAASKAYIRGIIHEEVTGSSVDRLLARELARRST